MSDPGFTESDIPDLYLSGHSLSKVSELTEINYSAVRRILIASGVSFRSKKEAVALHPGGWNSNRIGVKRPEFSLEWRAKMSESAQERWKRQGIKGFSIGKDGYVKITTGPNADRDLHVVIMEERIGRRLLPDENVHHIDRNPGNNDENNLALVTKAGHGRLHRFEDRLEGKQRTRNPDTGRFQPSSNK